MSLIVVKCLDLIAVNFNWSAPLWSIIQKEISSMKLRKPVLTQSVSHSTLSILCTNLVLHFSIIFSFLETIKHNMLKMLCIVFHLQY